MAELSLSQLIQESLSVPQDQNINEETNGPSFWDKTKEYGSKQLDNVKQFAQDTADKVGALNKHISKDDAPDDHWRNKLAAKWWEHRNKITGTGAALGTAGLAYGGYKAGKALFGKSKNSSIIDKTKKYVKKNPGKVAGASLAALGAGAGAAALIRYLRKKRKQG